MSLRQQWGFVFPVQEVLAAARQLAKKHRYLANHWTENLNRLQTSLLARAAYANNHVGLNIRTARLQDKIGHHSNLAEQHEFYAAVLEAAATKSEVVTLDCEDIAFFSLNDTKEREVTNADMELTDDVELPEGQTGGKSHV